MFSTYLTTSLTPAAPAWHHEIAELFPIKGGTRKLEQQYLSANDLMFFHHLGTVTAIAHMESKEENSVMLIVGESYLLSALPLLIQKSGAKILLHCDVDPEVLEYFAFCRNAFLQAADEADYLKKFLQNDNPLFKKNKAVPKTLLSRYEQEKKNLGKDHVFHNKTNFQQSQNAHREIIYVSVCIDLFDQAEVQALAEKIEGKITLLNLTNIREYDKAGLLAPCLNLLPVIEKPIILHSKYQHMQGSGLFPQTQAMRCSIADFNKTFLKDRLIHFFYTNHDYAICQKIRENDLSYINTPASNGLLPIEHAALEDFSKEVVKLYLSQGAMIPFRLIGNLEKNAKEYYQTRYNQTLIIDSDVLKPYLVDIEALIVQSMPTNARRIVSNSVLNDGFANPSVFLEVGEGAILFTQGDTYIRKICKKATIVVMQGCLIVDTVEDSAHLETRLGEMKIKQITGNEVRLVANGDITIEAENSNSIDILCQGNIQLNDIGDYSHLLASGQIHACQVGRESTVLAGGAIQVGHMNYGVNLATINGDISIDYNLPHSGMVSIHETGEIHYHMKSSTLSATSTIFNTKGLVINHNKTNRDSSVVHTNFISDTQAGLVSTYAINLLCELPDRPLYASADRSDFVEAKVFYQTILQIAQYTPKTFVEDFIKPFQIYGIGGTRPGKNFQSMLSIFIEIFTAVYSEINTSLSMNEDEQKQIASEKRAHPNGFFTMMRSSSTSVLTIKPESSKAGSALGFTI